MVLNFKNDINDFEEWYYASKKLEKKTKKDSIKNIFINILNFLFYVYILWYILSFLKNVFVAKNNNELSIFLGIIVILLFSIIVISKFNKRIFRILNLNHWYKKLLKLDNNFEGEKKVIVSDNILKVIEENCERIIDGDFKVIVDNKTIFIIKGEEFPKLIIPIMAINKEYTKDEFLERFTNIEVINI